MSTEKTRTIEVKYLARVEGEGGLKVKIRGNKVEDVQLNIFEPPRFFEAMLQGRSCLEAPDITSRICGICPIAYQMSAIHAVENALGITVSDEIEDLRRLIYLGEWIESHGLHVYMLHAPDFLRYTGAVEMAKDYPDVVKTGLQLKKVGNELMTLIGGREIHPINLRIGGFYRSPRRQELAPVLERLKWARNSAVKTVEWVASFPFPDWEHDACLVSLRARKPRYPVEEGTIVSSRGLSIGVEDYEKWFFEEHMPHSTALHSALKGEGPYLVGPLARVHLNFDRFSPLVLETAKKVGFAIPCKNPFKSIIARSLEILYACDEAVSLIEKYHEPEPPSVSVKFRAGVGFAVTEAPRGLLFHRYQIQADGIIETAKIVPPTSQNQKSIERDLWQFVEANLLLPRKDLSWRCEQTIRNYDPCISCSAHFLDVRWEET